MLQVADITKHYRGKTVLAGVGFTLAPGEALGIAGHNGSGKSTLLSIVAQVIPPSSGSILQNGASALGNRGFLRQSMGYVPQHNSLLGDLTVRETLRFWQKAYGAPANPFSPGAPGELLGLKAIEKKRVSTLSGGMQKRLSIALALMHRPRYLLLDEALSALDRCYRRALRAWLSDHLARGGSVLYCSHEVEELKELCHNILVLRQGTQAFYGPVAAFPTDTETLDVLMNPVARHPGAPVAI